VTLPFTSAFTHAIYSLSIFGRMLATTIPDHLIEEVKDHLVHFRELVLGKHKRPRTDKPGGGVQ